LTRQVLTDAQWKIIEPFCLGKKSDPGQTGGDTRLFMEGVLWIVRTGAQWRELPEVFGNWNSVFKRFRRWVKADVFYRMFRALAEGAGFEYAMIGGNIVKVHRSGQGEKGGSEPGHRTITRRYNHQNSGPRGCTGKSGRFPPDSRSGSRPARCQRPDP